MVRIVSYVLGLALLIAGAVWLADRPGAVVVDWLGWRIETTMPVLLIALLIVMLAEFLQTRLGWTRR